MAATFVMKYWGGRPLLLVLPACGGALLLAAVLEIEAMKTAEMARTFIIILALEFVLTPVCAIFLLDERYGVRDLFRGLPRIRRNCASVRPRRAERYIECRPRYGECAGREGACRGAAQCPMPRLGIKGR
jgi:hypothetical protein